MISLANDTDFRQASMLPASLKVMMMTLSLVKVKFKVGWRCGSSGRETSD